MKMKLPLTLVAVSAFLVVAAVITGNSPRAVGQEAPAKYKGTKACKACHANQYKSWQQMKHSHAFSVLKPDQAATGKDEQGRACIQCHTTGHGTGGFTSVDATPKLLNVGCEACHGPGSKHVGVQMAALAEDTEVTNRFISKSVDCTRCHNPHISYKKLYGGE